MSYIPNPDLLPCGCRLDYDIINGSKTMIISACKAGEQCKNVQYLIATMKAQGKPGMVIS